MLDKAKQMYDMQKKARALQKALKDTEVTASDQDNLVKITLSGEQHILKVDIDQSLAADGQKQVLEDTLKKVFAEAISKSQAVAAQKMKAEMGDLKIPGLS